MATNYPATQKVTAAQLAALLAEMAKAQSLTLNGAIPDPQLVAIAEGNPVPGSIVAVTRIFTAAERRHWYKMTPNVGQNEDFEFRTLLVQPSAAPSDEVFVRVFAQKSNGDFLVSLGGPIGSSVAHGAPGSSVAHGGISFRSFFGLGEFFNYYFRITLPSTGTPSANPYLLLLYRVA
jgi:hypothetical protein